MFSFIVDRNYFFGVAQIICVASYWRTADCSVNSLKWLFLKRVKGKWMQITLLFAKLVHRILKLTINICIWSYEIWFIKHVYGCYSKNITFFTLILCFLSDFRSIVLIQLKWKHDCNFRHVRLCWKEWYQTRQGGKNKMKQFEGEIQT